MVDNAYLPPDTEPSSSVGQKLALRSVLLWGLKCLVSYFAGVVVCVVATPVDVNLGGGILLWFLCSGFAWIGYPLFYLYLEGAYLPHGGQGVAYWSYATVGAVPFLLELLVHLFRKPRWFVWRPLWIGFPIGFVGTLGIYYTAAASI